MKPKARMYIDARGESFNKGNIKQVTYIVKGIETEQSKKILFEAIGYLVQRIEVVPGTEKVIVTYHENIISPTFIDYRLQLKGLEFRRDG